MEPTKDSPDRSPKRWVWKLVGGIAVAVVLGWIFRGFLWSVVEAVMLNVVPIVFTPVILELTVAFTGLFIVLLFSHFRRKDQEDEWVYISQVEPEEELEPIPEPLRRRVEETVMTSKPLEVEEQGELPLQAVEGLLELGLYDEVEAELKKGNAADQRRPGFVRLRLLGLLQATQWQQADDYVGTNPAPADRLALIAVEAAQFFVRQKPVRKPEATRCLELGKRLSVSAVMSAIDSDSKLQKLA